MLDLWAIELICPFLSISNIERLSISNIERDLLVMSGILSDLQNVYNAIKYLDDLRTSIEGNKERCRLLIERCNLFSEKISTMIKNTSLYRGNKSGILSLIETVDKCTEFVKKYGKKGWKRKCLNIAFAKDIETEFRDLNNSLQLASSDLQFFILIELG